LQLANNIDPGGGGQRKRRALSSLCPANARRNFVVFEQSDKSNHLLLKDFIAVAPIAIPFFATIN
jgi:hypothetical protein